MTAFRTVHYVKPPGGSDVPIDSDLVDSIYEAAAVPECWPDVLHRLAAKAGAQAGAIAAYRDDVVVGHLSSERYRDGYTDFLSNGAGLVNVRPIRALERRYPGFLYDLELCSAEELAEDEIYTRFLHPHGLATTAGSVVESPSADLMVFDIARAIGEPAFTRADMAELDLYRPHLARALLLGSRLGLRAARDMAHAMELVGLPAAALDREGTIIAGNSLIDALDDRFIFGAQDRLSFACPGANALFAQALAGAGVGDISSIPLPPFEGQPGLVVHVIPIRGAAADIFAAASHMLLVTEVGARSTPSVELLTGLFDLTPAEARVTRALAKGMAPSEIASEFGVSRQTVRNQLAAVFTKTGTTRQAELVHLVDGSAGFRGRADALGD